MPSPDIKKEAREAVGKALPYGVGEKWRTFDDAIDFVSQYVNDEMITRADIADVLVEAKRAGEFVQGGKEGFYFDFTKFIANQIHQSPYEGNLVDRTFNQASNAGYHFKNYIFAAAPYDPQSGADQRVWEAREAAKTSARDIIDLLNQLPADEAQKTLVEYSKLPRNDRQITVREEVRQDREGFAEYLKTWAGNDGRAVDQARPVRTLGSIEVNQDQSEAQTFSAEESQMARDWAGAINDSPFKDALLSRLDSQITRHRGLFNDRIFEPINFDQTGRAESEREQWQIKEDAKAYAKELNAGIKEMSPEFAREVREQVREIVTSEQTQRIVPEKTLQERIAEAREIIEVEKLRVRVDNLFGQNNAPDIDAYIKYHGRAKTEEWINNLEQQALNRGQSIEKVRLNDLTLEERIQEALGVNRGQWKRDLWHHSLNQHPQTLGEELRAEWNATPGRVPLERTFSEIMVDRAEQMQSARISDILAHTPHSHIEHAIDRQLQKLASQGQTEVSLRDLVSKAAKSAPHEFVPGLGVNQGGIELTPGGLMAAFADTTDAVERRIESGTLKFNAETGKIQIPEQILEFKQDLPATNKEVHEWAKEHGIDKQADEMRVPRWNRDDIYRNHFDRWAANQPAIEKADNRGNQHQQRGADHGYDV